MIGHTCGGQSQTSGTARSHISLFGLGGGVGLGLELQEMLMLLRRCQGGGEGPCPGSFPFLRAPSVSPAAACSGGLL